MLLRALEQDFGGILGCWRMGEWKNHTPWAEVLAHSRNMSSGSNLCVRNMLSMKAARQISRVLSIPQAPLLFPSKSKKQNYD